MLRVLITGITGRDGHYLTEFLHAKGYDVFGLVRGQQAAKIATLFETSHTSSRYPAIFAIFRRSSPLSSMLSLTRCTTSGRCRSWLSRSANRNLTAEITGLGVLRMLEAIRVVGGTQSNPVRFYQASSSEMFGKVRQVPQNESTPFHPRSPYGAAKVFGHQTTVNYREACGLFACNGILFNHEGPRRGPDFVTRKISKAVARIKLGLQETVALGNLHARRDWGFAGDYAEAMWMMLQQDEPDGYVVATGETHSVEEVARRAFEHAGIDDWERLVASDDRLFRTAEVDHLVGDASKAERVLGWKPKVHFAELVHMMVEADLKTERRAS